MLKYKKTHFILYFEGQLNLYPSVYLHFNVEKKTFKTKSIYTYHIIYGYFIFQFCTYHLFSVALNATLIFQTMCFCLIQINACAYSK